MATKIKEMPKIGFGTWKLSEKSAVVESVQYALRCGYRHIDTAAIYYNEKNVGEAIWGSGVPREEIFLVSKMDPIAMKSRETAYACALKSLKDLKTTYLIHWPVVDISNADNYKHPDNPRHRLEAWEVLCRLKKEGKALRIGVSNFSAAHLRHLSEHSAEVPFVNQIEFHPLIDQREVLKFCTEKGIKVEGKKQNSKGKLDLLRHKTITDIAEKTHRSPAQVLLRWSLEKGVYVIPKSQTKPRIKENLEAGEFSLREEDVEAIDRLMECGKRFCMDPADMN